MGKEDEYKEIFLAEALESCEDLNNLFTELEKDITGKSAVDAIFRITHTLKGNAMGMGFTEIAELSHVMEDLFNEVKSDRLKLNTEIFGSLFKANDVLGQLIHSLKSGEKIKYKGIKTKLEVILNNSRGKKPVESSETKEEFAETGISEVQKNNTLFERLGGKSALDQAVKLFYDKVVGDPRIAHFFNQVNFDVQRGKLAGFLAMAFGAPVKYTGKSLREAHEKLKLEEGHFTAVAVHLQETLIDMKVPVELINEVMTIVASTRNDVLNITDEAIDESDNLSDTEEELSQKIILSDVVQVPVRKLDALLNIIGELIIEKDTLTALNLDRGYQSNDLARLNRITSDLQYGVMDVRLVQIGFLFNKFHRILRDVAVIENKKVDLILEGTEIEIDRNILKIMSDSLVHLVRNSVSHGIETASKRKERGKSETGKVILRATNEKDTVYIEVIDDGNGIDPVAIRKKAVEKGLISAELAKTISDDDAIMYIFEPGFSNAEKVTEVSGRGVGMDVVKRAVESIGGKVEVKTVLGKGSTFTLSLPSSMAVKGALLFELGNQQFAIALSHTEAVISLRKSDLHKINNGLISKYLGKTISVLFLKNLFEMKNFHQAYEESAFHQSFDELNSNQKLDVVIVSYNNHLVGFVVDKLLQQKEIVEKTLQKPVEHIALFSGATIQGDGSVCLVLDVAGILSRLFKERVNAMQESILA